MKRIVGSRYVFIALIGLFAVHAVIIASLSSFPMAFDESYHLKLIEHYTETASPFMASQPADLDVVGDVTRLTSYLFHFIMSFPLKVVSLFTENLQAQIVVLRLINVGFVIAALMLMRVFFNRLTGSRVVTNAAVLLYCALPVTSLLAAHINYDNLLFLAFAGLLVSAQSIAVLIKDGKRLTVTRLSVFLSICLLGSLVKFTFLPIAMVVGLFVLVLVMHKKSWKRVSLPHTNRAHMTAAGSLVLCAMAVGLFAERVGMNVVEYGTPQPDCAAVQSVSSCMQYGPWARNHNLETAAAGDAAFEGRSVQGYAANVWVPLMLRGLGGVDDHGIVSEMPKPVLIGLMATAAALVVGMVFKLLRRKDPILGMVVTATGLYMLMLLQRNYSEFMNLHEIVAVQGRYILPFIIPVVAIGMIGMLEYMRLFARFIRNTVGQLISFGELEPREAYERSASYWSAKVWRRSVQG